MEQLRPVSKLEKILFPVVVTIVVVLILPQTAPLVGMLMLGNLFRESINGPKSVIAPTPKKINEGKILHSSNK